MQRNTTWIIQSLWGACERWSKSDCIDLSAAFAYYTLQSFSYSSNFSFNSFMVLRKTGRLRWTNNFYCGSNLPPSVVELVETTLFKLIDQGFGAGILGAMFCFLQQEMHIYLSKEVQIGSGKMSFLLKSKCCLERTSFKISQK